MLKEVVEDTEEIDRLVGESRNQMIIRKRDFYDTASGGAWPEDVGERNSLGNVLRLLSLSSRCSLALTCELISNFVIYDVRSPGDPLTGAWLAGLPRAVDAEWRNK